MRVTPFNTYRSTLFEDGALGKVTSGAKALASVFAPSDTQLGSLSGMRSAFVQLEQSFKENRTKFDEHFKMTEKEKNEYTQEFNDYKKTVNETVITNGIIGLVKPVGDWLKGEVAKYNKKKVTEVKDPVIKMVPHDPAHFFNHIINITFPAAQAGAAASMGITISILVRSKFAQEKMTEKMKDVMTVDYRLVDSDPEFQVSDNNIVVFKDKLAAAYKKVGQKPNQVKAFIEGFPVIGGVPKKAPGAAGVKKKPEEKKSEEKKTEEKPATETGKADDASIKKTFEGFGLIVTSNNGNRYDVKNKKGREKSINVSNNGKTFLDFDDNKPIDLAAFAAA